MLNDQFPILVKIESMIILRLCPTRGIQYQLTYWQIHNKVQLIILLVHWMIKINSTYEIKPILVILNLKKIAESEKTVKGSTLSLRADVVHTIWKFNSNRMVCYIPSLPLFLVSNGFRSVRDCLRCFQGSLLTLFSNGVTLLTCQSSS